MKETTIPHEQSLENRRIGVVAIIVNEPDKAHDRLNKILHDFSHIIIGRLGVPYRERNLSIISLIIDGNTDDVGAMTGRIGQLPGLTVKSAFAKNPPKAN
ncbi:CopG family transcriptional regulator [candidate division KSB1 bacterium]|nr:iron-only hydrogenase system regulator [candidate division KSB1 bacterium]RQW04291.1 MAG: CopG family transcriptional regulator [candidate division KSB1 bacterium]